MGVIAGLIVGAVIGVIITTCCVMSGNCARQEEQKESYEEYKAN